MRICLVLLLVCFFLGGNSKIVGKNFYRSDIQSHENSLFITKFDFGPNGGNIRILVMRKDSVIQSQLKLMVDVVLDSKHQEYKQSTCQQRRQYVLRNEQLSLKSKGSSDMRNLVMFALGREEIYYVYWAKCESQGLVGMVQDQNQHIKLQVTLYNDGSHFGQDQKIMTGYIVIVVLWIALMVRFAIPFGRILVGSNDKTKIISFIGLVMLGFSYLYRLLHLIIYYTNGQGIYFFEAVYIVLKAPCEFIIITLIVAVGWGWSITHLSYDQSYIVAGVASMLINTVCLILNGSAEEMVDIHHKYDSTPGSILLALRILTLLIFVTGVIRIYNRQSAAIRKFMKKLGAVGCLYLASWPLTVIFAECFLPNYMHNEVITFVEEFAHLIATWMLCSMLAHPESTYRKISIKEEDDPLRMQNYKRK